MKRPILLLLLLGAAALLPPGSGTYAQTPISPASAGAPTELAPFVVTVTRLPQDPAETAAFVDTFSTADLTATPALTLDSALRGTAAFSLFRRTDSLTANPTAQGVSLRGLGPSGASRTLVLLDGIPLNDPFGGWVTWSKVPRLTIDHAEIVRGGGSGAWGNAALGGTVQVFTSPPQPAGTAPGGTLALEAGSHATVRGEFIAHQPVGERARWQLGGRWFQTDGPMQYAREQRGAIDRPLDSEHALVHGGFATTLASGWQVSIDGRWFDEERGNGTPFQRNRSREQAMQARMNGSLRPDITLELLAYGQRQHFASGFSSVAPGRATETPALDQFDVPAEAWGAAAVATLDGIVARDALTALGADVRAVSGETREDFFFSDGDFLRRRHAGGDQLIGGVFAAHQQPLVDNVTAQVSARWDGWRNADGHRREWDRASGEIVRDEAFATTEGTEFSPSVGVTWQLSEALTWRASTYRAFRVPTLNELHRPFRVGNVATEANAALRRETVTGAEAGFAFTQDAWWARVNVFQNELDHGVANVTLSTSPTLTQRQRLNLDRIRVRGLEINAGWQPLRELELEADVLWTDARVQAATVAPDLEGRRLAQVPKLVWTLRASWRPLPEWSLDVSARRVSQQFEDDANTLPLAAATTVDAAIRYKLDAANEIHLAAENLLDARIETSRTASELVTLAPGLWIRAGWMRRW